MLFRQQVTTLAPHYTSTADTPPGIAGLGALSVNCICELEQCRYDGFLLPVRASGLRLETAHLLCSIFRSHAYPLRRLEACPIGKEVCSKAKLDEFFRYKPAICARVEL